MRAQTYIRKDGRRVIRSHRLEIQRAVTLVSWWGKRWLDHIDAIDWP